MEMKDSSNDYRVKSAEFHELELVAIYFPPTSGLRPATCDLL